jgi:hypothetical protein
MYARLQPVEGTGPTEVRPTNLQLPPFRGDLPGRRYIRQADPGDQPENECEPGQKISDDLQDARRAVNEHD